MKARAVALFFLALSAPEAVARALPIYIEDSHAGTFYWLAPHLDLDEPCTLIHFDAHSDASGIFDSDKIRAALRAVASPDEREKLLQQWRRQGAIQCFNWIEPLMPAPIARVVWVTGEKASPQKLEEQTREATALLDGHLEAAPRQAGSFRDRYLVSDLAHLPEKLRANEPLVITIDLDYFSGLPAAQQPAAFERVWNFVVQQTNLRAVTFAISRLYLSDDAEADRLLTIAITTARLLPMAQIYFEPFASAGPDRSIRARPWQTAGQPLPVYDPARASPQLRSILLAESDRIFVQQDQARWNSLLRAWRNETAYLHLELKNVQPCTDGAWRVAASASTAIELVAQPCTAKLERIGWFALEPAHPSCNVSDLNSEQVGFVAQAAPRPQWQERTIAAAEATLPIEKLNAFFDPKSHCGSLRVRARAWIDGKIRETPIIEVRRFAGAGFRAALTEQFGLPYLFGSGALENQSDTGAEMNLGSDCANFLVYAMRRQGLRVPWSDPKHLRPYLEGVGAAITPGAAQISADELERGLIVHLGNHVAAVMEDRPPLGLLDEGDLVAHQLKGFPETLTLGELLRQRHTGVFDLCRVPSANRSTTLTFGGDIMLGRSCATQITNGVDPFAGIRDLLARSFFAAANLECVLSSEKETPRAPGYSFPAPPSSAALLRRAGFRAVSLANNHALDLGPDALRRCAQILTEENVAALGVAGTNGDPYAPRIFELPEGHQFALLAISDLPVGPDSTAYPPRREPTNCSMARSDNRARLGAAINTARTKADLVACMVHWGIENTPLVTDQQRELARWLIDHGVDVVVGSHPHCLQPLDFYHGRPIAYSLGNLVFDGAPTVSSWNHGAFLQLTLSTSGKVQSADFIPVHLENGLPKCEQAEHHVIVQGRQGNPW